VGRLLFLEIIFPLYYYFLWADFSSVVFYFTLFFSANKAPIQGRSMRCAQCSSYKPPRTPTLLLSHVLHRVPLHLHERCHNLGVSKSTPCLHASIQATPCCLGLNALLWNAKLSSSNAGVLSSNQPIYMWPS
jgi:hypothetical protein